MSAQPHSPADAGGVVIAPPPSPAAGAPGTRRYSRQDVLKLGQSGRPWEFVPVALAALKIAPEDAALRFLLAAAYARLGLRTAAAEQIDLLPEAARADQGVQSLLRVLTGLPADEVGAEERIRTCESNVEVLSARSPERARVDLRGHMKAWAAKAAEAQWFRARDGNIVVRLRPGNAGPPPPWTRFRDDLGEALATAFPRAGAETTPGTPVSSKPCILEGIDPPWMLRRVWELTPPGADGFSAPVTVVQADIDEFLDGLACADLRPNLGEERLRVLLGPDASRRLGADLLGSLDTHFLGPVISLATTRARVSPRIEAVVEEAAGAQRREQERLEREVRAAYANRDRAWWAERYRDLESRPLRILIPTCRFSTFIRHSAADLAHAFEDAGHEARVVMEPDAHTHLSMVAYLRLMAEYLPDLVVLINYTRASLGDAVPPEVPFVCWVQDAMPHQFDASVGERQTELDFLVGHLHPELFTHFRYPRERTRAFPVAASERKFHTRPSDPEVCRRFECEIAVVMHHSETPEAMHERLVNESGRGGGGQRVLEMLLPMVRRIAAESAEQPVRSRLEAASREALRQGLGCEPEARQVALVFQSYCLPLADRILRHQTLGWAADLAEQRAWRLHLYGRGWQAHPRLRAFARGELEHGEELRAAYGAAAAHLHASIHTLVHQRVMECALSGGLPLCRLQMEALMVPTWRAQRSAALGRHPQFCDLETRRPGYAVADSAEAMALTSLLQSLGQPHEGALWIGQAERSLLAAVEPFVRHEYDPAWLLVDMAETTFSTKEELEHRIEQSLERPRWRRAISGTMACRVRERLTHGALAKQILELVAGSLGSDAGATKAGADEPATRADRVRSTLATQQAVCARFGLPAEERWARRVAEAYAPPAWARGAITPEDALFLYSMVQCVRPGHAIEIGVGSGASTALLLIAMADARASVPEEGPAALHSFDLHPWCYFDRSRAVGSAVAEMAPDLAPALSLHIRKTAVDAGAMFADDPVALAFIDGDHRHPWPTADLLALLPALRPGAWVVLHDIDLPEYARRHEIAHQAIVDWHQVGAALLFDAWPFEKLRGAAGAFNIGAVRIPEHGRVTAQDLARIIGIPWEVDVDERTRTVLGRSRPR